MHILTNAYERYEKPAKTGILYQLNVFIIHPCDPTVVICYLIQPRDRAVCITYLISHSYFFKL